MTQPIKRPVPKPSQLPPTRELAASRLREKAETDEVLGRHKNTGQKDHKGAR